VLTPRHVRTDGPEESEASSALSPRTSEETNHSPLTLASTSMGDAGNLERQLLNSCWPSSSVMSRRRQGAAVKVGKRPGESIWRSWPRRRARWQREVWSEKGLPAYEVSGTDYTRRSPMCQRARRGLPVILWFSGFACPMQEYHARVSARFINYAYFGVTIHAVAASPPLVASPRHSRPIVHLRLARQDGLLVPVCDAAAERRECVVGNASRARNTKPRVASPMVADRTAQGWGI